MIMRPRPKYVSEQIKMNLSEVVVALDSLRWDVETARKLKESDKDYYSDVLSEACKLINDMDR